MLINSYSPPFHADAVSKLIDAGAIIIGQTNMDEFGMGSLNRNSANGPAINGHPFRSSDSADTPRLSPGGSSGGSASSVSFRSSFAALGTDTGGSVRLPAAWCGVTGFKPGYGKISRHGVIAYASSLDTVGILAATPEDCKLIYDICKGGSELDSTSNWDEDRAFSSPSASLNNLKIGIPLAYSIDECSPIIKEAWASSASHLESLGAEIVILGPEKILPETIQKSLAAYYVVACAEAASNLAKYDGLRFGNRERDETISFYEEIQNTRKKFFGSEVQDRIDCGNAVLSKDGEHYLQANAIRHSVKAEFASCFEDVDVILIPSQVSLPVTQDGSDGDEVEEAEGYGNDLMTCGVSLAGLPAISVPAGEEGTDAARIGVQLVASVGDEAKLLEIAKHLSTINHTSREESQ
jgi:aspartyl-tRNA(Asn)/glutamyl-tRNA(Gln) amidotransferase subunit A